MTHYTCENDTKETELKMPALIYSRIVGYYSPVNKDWNKGKKEEFRQRKTYKLPEGLNENRALAKSGGLIQNSR